MVKKNSAAKGNGQRILLAGVAVAVLVGGGYWYFKGKGGAEPNAAAQGGGATPVEVVTATIGSMAETLEVAGQTQPNTGVELRSEVTGKVMALKFKDGQAVKKGDPLVIIDDGVQRAGLAQAEANLALAEANVGRYQRLADVGASSQLQVDQAVAELKLQKANVLLARTNLAKYRIVAPFDGIAGISQVNLGDLTQPGELLLALTDNATLKITFKVPETQATSLRAGADVTVRAEAAPGVASPTVVSGTVAALDGRVDPNSRTVEGKIVLDNADGALVSGQFVRVNVPVREVSDAVILPDAALLPQGTNMFAYVVVPGKDGGVAVSRTNVTVGLRTANRAQIVAGVQAGQQVVTAGFQKLRGPMVPATLLSPTAIDVPPNAVEQLQ